MRTLSKLVGLCLTLTLAVGLSACGDKYSSGACDDAPNPCEVAGQSQCEVDQVLTCTPDVDGCLQWAPTQTCTAEEVCVYGACQCTDVCASGASQCAANAVETCTQNANGCLGWSVVQDCAATGGTCDDTVDPPECVGGSEVCGDDFAEGAELCDGADLAGETCQGLGYDSGTLLCNATCDGYDTAGCTTSAVCGDDAAEGPELCDGADLAGETCVSQGFTGGSLACNGTCDGFDTTGCTSAPVCGDDTAEGAEVCDGADLAGETCVSQGYTGGTLACNATCSGYDATGCTSSPVCGNGIVEGTELCDTGDLAGETCLTQGFTGGTLACGPSCAFDTTGCTGGGGLLCEPCVTETDCTDPGALCIGFAGGDLFCGSDCATTGTCPTGYTCYDLGTGTDFQCAPTAGDICDQCTPANCPVGVCGNGVTEVGEVCDGADVGSNDCTTYGYAGGTLGCESDCSNYDTTGCTGGTGSELCEPCAVDGDCAGAGAMCIAFVGGEQFCGTDCAATGTCPTGYTCYDLGTGTDFQCAPTAGDICDQCTPTNCPASVCGNGVCEAGETNASCPADCPVVTCGNGVCDAGETPASCPADCAAPACGDGTIDAGEECDGANLGGETCVTQGFTGGTLACDASCQLDTSGCTTTGWTCNPAWYGDTECDCGCGIQDIDCADALVGSCDWCLGCNASMTCPGDINPTQNWECVAAQCGDGSIDAGENCDGADLGGETCLTLGYGGGTLACDGSCQFDVSGCTAVAVCGNDTIEGAELCDGVDLGGETCVTQGFTSGTLACEVTCAAFDTSGCSGSGALLCETCADSSDCANAGAECIAFSGGVPFCGEDCSSVPCPTGYSCYDLSGAGTGPFQCAPTAGDICAQCTPTGCPSGNCGNGAVDAGEQCDGNNLAGETCTGLGYTGGTLACDGSCQFDTTGCTGTGWTCNPAWYGDGECDCGCGIIDVDCADGTVGSCDWCLGCNVSQTCPGDIDPTQNWQCL